MADNSMSDTNFNLNSNSSVKNSPPIRKIQSFVRRGGRLTASQKNGLSNLWQKYGLERTQSAFDLNHIFTKPQATILEIGFGNGDSLLAMANLNTHLNYLGIEVYEAGVGRLIAGAQKAQLNNLKILKEDATEILRHHLADNSLSGVQIFFPDPWHKKKHHKRRLIQSDLLDLLSQKLKPQGFLHIATDWQDYAQHIDLCLNQHSAFKNTQIGTTSIPRPDSRPITKFEKRGIGLGHGVWDFLTVNKQ